MARPQCDNTPLVLRTPHIKGHYLACITSIILIFNAYCSVILVEYLGEKLRKKVVGVSWKLKGMSLCEVFCFLK